MDTELILKRENGDSYKIVASAWFNRAIEYRVQVMFLPKGKRKWQYVHSSDDYSWRKLDSEGRKRYEMDVYLKVVSAEEIMEAKLMLWESLKPITK